MLEVLSSKDFSKSLETGKERLKSGQKLGSAELHKMATRIALFLEKHDVAHGDLVIVGYSCPIKILIGIYGCWYRGAVPVPVKASNDSVSLLSCVAEQSTAAFALLSSKKTYSTCLPKAVKILEIGEYNG